ncbi:lipoprotein YmbA [Salinisphaera sp. T5B8]|uniref:PqiC family protein n=1 Tax=Salinisphaera sp. T5B8 TaxID=1304154 RepID=UPI00333E705E
MTMRYLTWLVATALLAGCAGSASAPSLYVLDSAPAARLPVSPAASQAQLVVAPVEIAPILDERGIVYQTAPHRVVIANHNRWAAPLDSQLRDALIANLGAALPGVTVVRRAPAGQASTMTLHTRVDRFMGHYDGQARIAGIWRLAGANDETLIERRFTRDVALEEDGYDALVDSLAAGWQDSAEALADDIAHTVRPSP